MNRKLSKLILTATASLACCFPLLTHADDDSPQQAKSLAVLERMLQYCGSIDPDAAAKLHDKIKDLTKDLSEQQVAGLRKTSEYQSSYSVVEGFVGQVDEHNAKKLCAESVSATSSSAAANNK